MRFANEYGFYELNPFPGCNQMVVSNHAFIYPKYRGQGFGKKQHQERLDKAKELGYSMIICTVREGNVAEESILARNGWQYAGSFFNIETNNHVKLYTKNLDLYTKNLD